MLARVKTKNITDIREITEFIDAEINIYFEFLISISVKTKDKVKTNIYDIKEIEFEDINQENNFKRFMKIYSILT
jgi:cupin superfamily acireductone dioxygenase involved in methionine salvage